MKKNFYKFVVIIFTPIFLLNAYQGFARSIEKPSNNDEFIIGEWSLCSLFTSIDRGEGSGMTANVCHSLVFKEDHSGKVKFGNGVLSTFLWKINNGKLIIEKQTNTKPNELFNFEGTLEILQVTGKSFQEIDLINNARHIKYILLK